MKKSLGAVIFLSFLFWAVWNSGAKALGQSTTTYSYNQEANEVTVTNRGRR